MELEDGDGDVSEDGEELGDGDGEISGDVSGDDEELGDGDGEVSEDGEELGDGCAGATHNAGSASGNCEMIWLTDPSSLSSTLVALAAAGT